MTLAPGSTLPVLEMNRSGIVLVYSLLCLIFFFYLNISLRDSLMFQCPFLLLSSSHCMGGHPSVHHLPADGNVGFSNFVVLEIKLGNICLEIFLWHCLFIFFK